MFGKVFGGPVVQLVEYESGRVVFKSKKEFTIGCRVSVRVAGRLGKPAKVQGVLEACRPLECGGYACLATVEDQGHCRELDRLSNYRETPEPGLRQSVRHLREIPIEGPDFQATTIDVSAGGLQLATAGSLVVGQTLSLTLTPGLTCRARVAWIGPGRAGVEFIEIDAVTKMLLERFACGRAVHCSSLSGTSASPLSLITPPDYQ